MLELTAGVALVRTVGAVPLAVAELGLVDALVVALAPELRVRAHDGLARL